MATRRRKERKTDRRTVRNNARDNSRRTQRVKQDKQSKKRRRARTQKKPKRAKLLKSLYHSGKSKAQKFKDVILRMRNEGTSAFEVQNDYSPPVYEFIKRNYEEEMISIIPSPLMSAAAAEEAPLVFVLTTFSIN